MIRRCRTHRNLVTKEDWLIIDIDIHSLQLVFNDDLFNRGAQLMLQKWRRIPSMRRFADYFEEQWVSKLPYW